MKRILKAITSLLSIILGSGTAATAASTADQPDQNGRAHSITGVTGSHTEHFHSWWIRMNEMNPTDFPLEMSPQEWTDRWEAWAEWMGSNPNPNPNKFEPFNPKEMLDAIDGFDPKTA